MAIELKTGDLALTRDTEFKLGDAVVVQCDNEKTNLAKIVGISEEFSEHFEPPGYGLKRMYRVRIGQDAGRVEELPAEAIKCAAINVVGEIREINESITGDPLKEWEALRHLIFVLGHPDVERSIASNISCLTRDLQILFAVLLKNRARLVGDDINVNSLIDGLQWRQGFIRNDLDDDPPF